MSIKWWTEIYVMVYIILNIIKNLCPPQHCVQVEAEVLVDLLTEFPEAKAWISFSCKVKGG